MKKDMLSIIAIIFLPGLLLSTRTFADNIDTVDQIQITVPVSCTMSGTGMNTHNAEIVNGNYNSAIGETVIKAFCNDNNGFAIYAIGYTDNTDGKNVLTSDLGSTYDIITGTATSSVSGNDLSQWAMKLSTVSSPTPSYPIVIAGSTDDAEKEQGDPDYSFFQEVPDDYTKVVYRNSATDINPTGQNTAEGSTIKTTYQAYISKTQPAGTYTGQVKYTLVHPVDAAAPRPRTIANSTTMQEVELCPETLVTEQVYTLTDIRDNQTYKVAKLADGKCWMVENLNITGGTALSYEDTDFESSYTLPTTNNWTVLDGKLILPASLAKTEINILEGNGFDNDYNAILFNSENKTNCGGYNQNNIPCYSYYSYGAATVGSYTNRYHDGNPAPYSICPKGWRLPLINGSQSDWKKSDFYTLATAYGANLENDYSDNSSETGPNFFNNAGPGTTPGFLLSIGYLGSRFGGIDGDYYGQGVYWYAENGGVFDFNKASVTMVNGITSSSGLAVRCVLRTE